MSSTGMPHHDRADADVLWKPSPDVRATTRIGNFLSDLEETRGLRFPAYQDLWAWSVDELPAFWSSVAEHFNVLFDSPPLAALGDRTMPGAEWFSGATLNYAEHALRGVEEQVVVIARSQTRDEIELTRGELRDAVARARSGLRRLGVQPGDRVAAYLPNTPEALIAMLATVSLGAVWAVCAPEFGTQAVLDRLVQIEPKVLIAIDGYRYGRREIDRREEVRTLVAGLATLEHLVTVPYLFDPIPADLATTWEKLLAEPAPLAYEHVPFDHPLWVLFSSGTTGLPKAIVHGHGGIVLEQLKSTALQSDLGGDDRYFFFCPTGWVVWNLLVSALLAGSAIVMVDGDAAYPDGAQLWRTIAETRTTAFGCGATFLMLARGSGMIPGDIFDLSCLRSISSTGSPLPAEGFRWVYDAVKADVYLQSSSGGTDICGAFVGGSPLLPVRAGRIAARCLGVRVDALDADGAPLEGELGELVVSEPMPSMPVAFWNDPGDERYRETYFTEYPGRWRHGDWIQFDPDGSCVVTGRSDATLNRGGVRLGTSEFYAALSDLEEIADSLVVHLDDREGGLGRLVLFVELAPGAGFDEALRARVAQRLRSDLSPRHVPDTYHAVPGIPYNLTGKKLEIPVKRMLLGAARAEVISDGALRDPAILDAFERLADPGSHAEKPRRMARPLHN